MSSDWTALDMKLGYFHVIPDGDRCRADAILEAATSAERVGAESFWLGEHVVLPAPRTAGSPLEPGHPILDPLMALSFVAAVTTRIRLGTGIIILPQRNPVVLAKQVASLDVLSGGRLDFGVGVGYLKSEFDAIGVEFSARGKLTDEYLKAMSTLWYDEHPHFLGETVHFEGVDAHPRPLQRPVPIVVGGNSPPSYRRAVASGHCWYGFRLAPDLVETSLAGLRLAGSQVERPSHLGRLEITVTPPGRLTPHMVAAYAQLGVDRLVVLPNPKSRDTAATVASALAAVDDALE
jgi:probable F420-dependent oxidoreductase